MSYYQKIGMEKTKYISILKEINEWEANSCDGRDESIDELSETVYPEILEFMAEDGFDVDEVQTVMFNRDGGNLNEWKQVA